MTAPFGEDGASVDPNATTRRLFASLTVAAVIPVLLFAASVLYVTADTARTNARSAAGETLMRVAQSVAAALSKEIEVAQTLAASPSLDKPHLNWFYEIAGRVAPNRPLWETVALVDPSGMQTLNLLRPLGEALGAVADRASFEKVLRSETPEIGGIGPVGPVSGRRLVSLAVPVMREGRLRFVLMVGISPRAVRDVLRQSGAPEGWSGAIVDAQGNIIASSAGESEDVGRVAGEAVRKAMARAPAGFYTSKTQKNTEIETIYRRLGGPSGWSVHFGVPADALNTPVSVSLSLLLSAGVASLLMAYTLAQLVGEDIAQRRRIEEARSRKHAEAERLELRRRLGQAQENEQRRIARELHDQVGQTVTGLSLGLKRLEQKMEDPDLDEATREHMRWLQGLAVEIGRDIHRTAADLRPTALDDLGLHKAVSAYATEWGAWHGLNVEMDGVGLETRLAPEVETAAFRAIQEALTNILKHARATRVRIDLQRRDDALAVEVADDGVGFRPEAMGTAGLSASIATPPRLGLLGLRERLALLGGRILIDSAPGEGARLRFEIPLTNKTPALRQEEDA